MTRSDDPGDLSVVRRIYDIRSEVRRRDARPNDGRCGNVAAALETEFGWPRQSGYLKLLDDTVSWVHCWNRLADGTVVDATADQFQGLWLGDVITIDPSDPMSANYRHAPSEWKFHFDQDALDRVTCYSGDDVQFVLCEATWTLRARAVLRLVTGWELGDELVELAARVLRAKASTEDVITSGELTHPLLIWSIQHLGKQSTPPWIAAEFRAPL